VAAETPEQLLTDPPHADFWRAMPDGRLLLIRGYAEDATENVAAGSVFDVDASRLAGRRMFLTCSRNVPAFRGPECERDRHSKVFWIS
jgi:hypothetical protein